MKKLRLCFCKTGRAKYISHLDMLATIRRALLRAGVSLEYSEGFNPHPYLSVALPLSVGCGSMCELMDIGIPDACMPAYPLQLINNALPEGLEVTKAYSPIRKFSQIAWLGISGELYYDTGAQQRIADELSERFSAESIVIAKKTKRGASDTDIAPFIRETQFRYDGNGQAVYMTAKVSAQNPTVSPENLISALDGRHKQLAPDFALFTRTEVFDAEMNVFR